MFTPWFDSDATFADFDGARRQIDSLLRALGPGGDRERGLSWANVEDEGSSWMLRADVPGLETGDITLTMHGGELRVTGERKLAPPQGYQARRQERRAFKFERTVSVPDSIDAEKVTAELANGVLTVRLPKRPEVQPRTITINPA